MATKNTKPINNNSYLAHRKQQQNMLIIRNLMNLKAVFNSDVMVGPVVLK